jgi:hypothetical protein
MFLWFPMPLSPTDRRSNERGVLPRGDGPGVINEYCPVATTVGLAGRLNRFICAGGHTRPAGVRPGKRAETEPLADENSGPHPRAGGPDGLGHVRLPRRQGHRLHARWKALRLLWEDDDTTGVGPYGTWCGPFVFVCDASGSSFKGNYGKHARAERDPQERFNRPDAAIAGRYPRRCADRRFSATLRRGSRGR